MQAAGNPQETLREGENMKTKFKMETAVSFFLIMFMAAGAFALDYPQKPVTFIVPYPAGGRTDTIGRLYAQVFQNHLGQAVVIVNKPGAGGAIGAREAIKAVPDGYTLAFAAAGLVASKYTLPEHVDFTKSLEPIARVNFDPMFLVVAEKMGMETLKDLIAFGRKNPRKIKMGAQQGSAMFLYGNAFMKAMGIEPNYIYFSGGGEAKVALAGGHIDIYFDAAYAYEPLVDAKKVRFLAVSAEKRHPRHPHVPTFKEEGIPMIWGGWEGLFAPKGTPPAVLQFLEETARKTCGDKPLLAMAEKSQVTISYLNRAEFINFIARDDKTYREIATELGLYKP